MLDHVLRLCIATWEGEDNSFSANILNALAKLITTYGETLNDEMFKEKLGAVSIKQLIRTAKERRPGMLGVAEAMVIEYNGKKKTASVNRLSMHSLYEKPKQNKESDTMSHLSDIEQVDTSEFMEETAPSFQEDEEDSL